MKKITNIMYWNNLHLNFDEEQHQYMVDGVVKSSVSGMLDYFKTEEEIEKFNSPEFQEFLKPYAEFGTYIHKETEKIDRGMQPSPMDYDEKEWVALERYQILTDKLRAIGYEVVAIELALYSNEFDVCGTVDRLFYNEEEDKYILADIKTGQTRDSHWYQQLSYASMLNEWGIKVDDIALISLKLKTKVPMFSALKDDKREELLANFAMMKKEKNEY